MKQTKQDRQPNNRNKAERKTNGKRQDKQQESNQTARNKAKRQKETAFYSLTLT